MIAADGTERAFSTGGRTVLSRGLCRFRLFRAPVGLSRAQIARAARTFAEAHAPFEDSGILVLRSPLGAEIWYWDRAVVGDHRAVPESVLRPDGQGWRVLACDEGFEAQYWDEGGLVASTWRRGAFGRDQWAAFVLGVDQVTTDAPDAPPEVEHIGLALGRSWRAREIKPPPTWREAEQGALTLGLCASALALFFVGQALHADFASNAVKIQAAAAEQRIGADPRLTRVREHTALLRDYADAMSGADVLAAAAQAFEVFKQFNVEVSEWRVDQRNFRATLNASMADVPLREIVAALEASSLLCRVEPNLSSAEGSLELTATLSSSPTECAGGQADGATQ